MIGVRVKGLQGLGVTRIAQGLQELGSGLTCNISKNRGLKKRGQCGLAMSRSLVGANPTWVIVSREPSIEPCGATGNGRVDA